MTTTHHVRALAVMAFAVIAICSFASVTHAQTCTLNAQCPPSKFCNIPNGASQGTCQTPPNPTPSTGQAPSRPGVGQNDEQGVTLTNPLKANSIEELLSLVLKAAVRLGTIVLILMFVWVGFLFVAARGSEENLRKAKSAFFWTVIGGLILLGAEAIARVIQATASAL